MRVPFVIFVFCQTAYARFCTAPVLCIIRQLIRLVDSIRREYNNINANFLLPDKIYKTHYTVYHKIPICLLKQLRMRSLIKMYRFSFYLQLHLFNIQSKVVIDKLSFRGMRQKYKFDSCIFAHGFENEMLFYIIQN